MTNPIHIMILQVNTTTNHTQARNHVTNPIHIMILQVNTTTNHTQARNHVTNPIQIMILQVKHNNQSHTGLQSCEKPNLNYPQTKEKLIYIDLYLISFVCSATKFPRSDFPETSRQLMVLEEPFVIKLEIGRKSKVWFTR